MKKYYWSGISNKNRIQVINELTDVINQYATILNFQRFSDLSLSLMLEIEEDRLNGLLNGLKKIMSIESDNSVTIGSKEACIILLNITFTKGSGDYKIKVPAIPR